ncbi:NAD(P)/FAD-dependent oxidoreductase [Citricoccus alkalitolerans]|uniref:NAD(P)/FAD-dependent oxidoreductase n=1 Tax=Citricoccus alkalitolerans TaxID=246603 RepID=A0ABV8XUS6_9MICC
MTLDRPSVFDALVVGGGPAGLSAATWLGRYRSSTLVVDAGRQRNLSADHSHGLLGRDPTTPQELLTDAHAGLEQYPEVMLRHGSVTAVHQSDEGLFRATVDGAAVFAKRMVLATGMRDQLPELAGFHAHYGTDVFHCPACDGYNAREQTVIVLGSGDQLPAYAAELLDWAVAVRMITGTDGESVDDEQRAVLGGQGIEVVDGVAEALVGPPGSLRGVRLAGGRLVEGDQVFFSHGHHPLNVLGHQLGCRLDHEGRIAVDDFQLTSVDGVYAAGDITAGFQLIPVAMGEGTTAGVACATSLRGDSGTSAASRPE